MNSLSFPNMFASNKTSTLVVDNHKATYNNLFLALLSGKGSLLGDPEFGSLLKARLFEQNNIILQDLIIDDIYTTILTFLPQIEIDRKNIKVISDGTDVSVEIKCKNIIGEELDTFVIGLTS